MSSNRRRHRSSPGIRDWWARISESIQARLWPIPVFAIVVAVALGIVLTGLDVRVDPHLSSAVDSAVFNGGADTARSVLSAIAGSLITATSLTFSLTVIALQLASSQASPRVLRLFARDPRVHWTLAAFLGTFAYSITVLRSVRSDSASAPEFVPRISVTIAFVLTLVSVVMLVFFLAHLAAQLRVETMLRDIHAETDGTIDLVSERNEQGAESAFPHPIRIPPNRHAVPATDSGFVTRHDHDALMDVAAGHAIVVREEVFVGASIVAGLPLASWWRTDHGSAAAGDSSDDGSRDDGSGDDGSGEADEIDGAIRAAFTIGYERTAAQDIDYGIQQITDIAVRALSPGVNDPTTAVNALGHLSALLSRVLSMPTLPVGLAGDDGELLLVPMARTAAEDVDAALTGIRHYGADDPSVVARFVQVASEVSASVPALHVRQALLAQLDALSAQLERLDADPASVVAAADLVERARAEVAAGGGGLRGPL